jgi:2-dehydro-3-deoxygalactonokinase
MVASGLYNSSMACSCIAVDWGTTNRRAWALDPGGQVMGDRADSSGLLAVQDRRFAESLEVFLGDWLDSSSNIPVVIAGMAGSRMGWVEVPYVTAPAPLADLAQNLMKVGRAAASDCWIVPGLSLDGDAQPEVMRGEECQILGALLVRQKSNGTFLLPGTHSKWARVSDRRLIAFRTYITGEMFNLLRQSGTLAQLMTGDATDEDAFARGVHAAGPDTELLNRLFSARSLALFGRLEGGEIASYVSGMLIATEMRDALAAWPDLGRASVVCVGSAGILARYGTCAKLLGLDLQGIDNKDVLPAALFWIAQQAGLMPQ